MGRQMPASWALGSAPGARGELERAMTGCSGDPVDSACWKSCQDPECRRDPPTRRGQGRLAHSPFQARAVPQFPCRVAAHACYLGSCVPALGGEAPQRTLGHRRAGAKALFSRCAWEGGPRPASRLRRAIPEKVCRRADSRRTKGGGGLGILWTCCDSIPLTRRFKGRTASAPGRERSRGGSSGAFLSGCARLCPQLQSRAVLFH